MKKEKNIVFYHFTETPEGQFSEVIPCTIAEAHKLFDEALEHDKFDYFDITSAKTGSLLRSHTKEVSAKQKGASLFYTLRGA